CIPLRVTLLLLLCSFLSPSRLPPRSTLFPYTTLFRSRTFPQSLFFLQTLACMQSLPATSTAKDTARTEATTSTAKCFKKMGLERSEEHTSELQSRFDLVCRLLLEKKKKKTRITKATIK